MRNPVSINLPFSGFYESKWSGEIDHEESSHIQYEAEYRQAEDGIPEELRLNESELWEIYYRHTDYSAAYHATAECYVDAFDSIVSEQLGIKLGLEFEEMTSPREYNFETDRIFARIRLGVVYLLFRRSRQNGHERLAQMIKERFTSRSGFISYYRNDLDEWLAKPLRDWDHNEFGTLLMAVWSLSDEFESDDWEWNIFESVCGEGLYQEWSDAVDWPKVDSDIEELRNEKQEELKQSPDYVEPVYRCPSTLDLFQHEHKAT